jgi:hypothetical protein
MQKPVKGPVAIHVAAMALSLGCLAACDSSCPPDSPCKLPDGGLEFTCGSSRCNANQYCLTPLVCQGQGYEQPSARCVPRSSACSEPAPCGCVPEAKVADAGVEPLVCCYPANWQPTKDPICTAGCM